MRRKTVLMFMAIMVLLGSLIITNEKINVLADEPICTITFDGDGGNIIGWETVINTSDSVSYWRYQEIINVDCYKDSIVQHGCPYYGERDGKVLDGFYIDGTDTLYYLKGAAAAEQDGDVLYIDDFKPTEDVTFIAHYVDAYKITIKANGGMINDIKKKEGTTESATVLAGKGAKLKNIGDFLCAGDKEGYILEGLMNIKDQKLYICYPGKADNNLRDFIVNEDTVFEAVWTEDTSPKITFKFDGGYSYVSGYKYKKDYVYNACMGLNLSGEFEDLEVMKNDDPNKEFIGWKSDKDGKTYTLDELRKLPYIVSVSGSVTFTAQWKDNSASGDKSDDSTKKDDKSDEKKYSEEWVDGKWYNKDGTQTYKGTMQWKSNATGWWIEDSAGWYPTNTWQKIDGTWYFFKPDGYMAANEYYNGYWFNKDGSWDSQYLLSWKSSETGWWVEDISGWWPQSSWLKIDGYWYYFDASGYMVTNQYIDGWWIGADGVCY